MSTIRVVFHFDTTTETVERQEIIDYLADSGDYSPGELEALSDQELLAQLNENGVDEFFENSEWFHPDCFRCDVAEEE